jgi:uncharacterized protein (TIGR02145 family)
MKKRSLVLVAIIMFAVFPLFAQVGIGTSAPDSSAILELQSADQGFLPPRLTTIQRDAITNPAEGLTIYNTDRSCLEFYTGFGWRNICTDSLSTDVVSPGTGRIWMDRNLGASRVAIDSADAASFGDLYQWGRFSDGHESRTSATFANQATSAAPNSGNSWDGLFILNSNDWLQTLDNNLWQGSGGTNNPCPSGYRVPTIAEWNAESQGWADASDAFSSVLKLTMAGARIGSSGVIVVPGGNAFYWSSTVSGSNPPFIDFLGFNNSGVSLGINARSNGFSVRCIKE